MGVEGACSRGDEPTAGSMKKIIVTSILAFLLLGGVVAGVAFQRFSDNRSSENSSVFNFPTDMGKTIPRESRTSTSTSVDVEPADDTVDCADLKPPDQDRYGSLTALFEDVCFWNVSRFDGQFALGNLSYDTVGGIEWITKKVGEQWRFIFRGQDSPPCAMLKFHNVPESFYQKECDFENDGWVQYADYIQSKSVKGMVVSNGVIYHNQQYQFSFRHPSNWGLVQETEYKDDLVFVNKKPEKNFSSGTVMLRIKVGTNASESSELDWLKRYYPGDYYEMGAKTINGVLWHAYDPISKGDFPYAPQFPFLIAKIGDAMYLFEPGYYSRVSDELNTLISSARFGSWFTSLEVPFKQYGPRPISDEWRSTKLSDLDLDFHYPKEWSILQITSLHRNYVYGSRYLGGWPEQGIQFFFFGYDDGYYSDSDSESRSSYRPFNVDDGEEVFQSLAVGHSFFEFSEFDLPRLGKVKALRGFEQRNKGTNWNIALTYLIPNVRESLNLYLVVDLNTPVDVKDTNVRQPFTGKDLKNLLQNSEVQNRIAIVDAIVQNIGPYE